MPMQEGTPESTLVPAPNNQVPVPDANNNVACPRCAGTGQFRGMTCDLCSGTGKIAAPKKIDVGDKGGGKDKP